MHLFEITYEVIEYYREESSKAIKELNKILNFEIEPRDFQNILGEKFGYVNYDSHKIATNRLNAFQMLTIVRPDDFSEIEYDELVLLENTILPQGLRIALFEETIKSKGEIWRIHANDKDPFPSNPHAHNLESGYKLHLGSGELFDTKNNALRISISKKNLLLIRAGVKKITLPKLLD